MRDVAVRTESLSKRYAIGSATAPYGRLTESLWRGITSVRRGHGKANGTGEVWALRDVSLEVEAGAVVGIIGRNGAGKTTLLKILSRITEPTTGQAELFGRVGSLLEVGTGFHPELTGHENIYLNGAILGMSRVEIRRKFDEIVAFSEIERFLDTPVKRYSSGMYVRLAFAVAAHLQPEILIVDEVLAVGDASFQRKCLGKMEDVATEGRTVLFVSHNMAAVSSLCSRACWLDAGRICASGETAEVVEAYLREAHGTETVRVDERLDRTGDGAARIASLSVSSANGGGVISSASQLEVTIGYSADRPLRHAQFLIGVYDFNNTGIFLLDSDAAGGLPEVLPSEGVIRCITDPINLTPGPCYVNVAVRRAGGLADYVQRALVFDVAADDFYGSGKLPARDWAITLLRQDWHLNEAGGHT
jgi:lipopolysaccharide transport system ATP-binding protein